jgi:hypothetical protein
MTGYTNAGRDTIFVIEEGTAYASAITKDAATAHSPCKSHGKG